MKIFLILLLVGTGLWLFSYNNTSNLNSLHPPAVKNPASLSKSEAFIRIKKHVKKITPFVKSNLYENNYCFLVDMKILSGKNRFLVYDLKADSIIDAGLVTHGSGSLTATDSLIFSNKPNSLATSLGMYKIGEEYNGKFGMAFKMMGLEANNSNAFKRFVVLHAHPYVPTEEVAPRKICTSWGCPTVAPTYLQTLKKYIDKADKPVLLYIYY